MAPSVGGYYAGWMARAGSVPENFDPRQCTHIYYAFIGLSTTGKVKILDYDLEGGASGLYSRITALKRRNPSLKVILSVGGATGGSADLFSGMARDPAKRRKFIYSATDIIATYDFDGLDIDWEHPSGADRANYKELLKRTNEQFESKGWLLTAAVASSPKEGYHVGAMNKYLDLVNIMSYDFYGPWGSYTGQNSALYASSVESDWEKENLNLVSCTGNWLRAGLQRQKMVVGTAFYGRSFTLKYPNQHGLHAPIIGAGVDDGTPSYKKICTSYDDWTKVWDSEQKNPYIYRGNQWIGYDDKDSIFSKGAWIKRQRFNGAMVWTINYDDVTGQYGEKQGLLKQLNRGLRS